MTHTQLFLLPVTAWFFSNSLVEQDSQLRLNELQKSADLSRSPGLNDSREHFNRTLNRGSKGQGGERKTKEKKKNSLTSLHVLLQLLSPLLHLCWREGKNLLWGEGRHNIVPILFLYLIKKRGRPYA